LALGDAVHAPSFHALAEAQSGAVDQIKVGREPHGLTVWPQPGRYSLGHTGNFR
jgi:hypothetical protein